jgi:hypothetical protein
MNKENLSATKWNLYKLRLEIAQATSDEKYTDEFIKLIYLNRFNLSDYKEMLSFMRVHYEKIYNKIIEAIKNVKVVGSSRKVIQAIDNVLNTWNKYIPKEGDIVHCANQIALIDNDTDTLVAFYVFWVEGNMVSLMNREYLRDDIRIVHKSKVFPK